MGDLMKKVSLFNHSIIWALQTHDDRRKLKLRLFAVCSASRNPITKLITVKLNKKAVLSQGNRAMQRVFAYWQLLFYCYLHSLHKSRCECETANE